MFQFLRQAQRGPQPEVERPLPPVLPMSRGVGDHPYPHREPLRQRPRRPDHRQRQDLAERCRRHFLFSQREAS